MWSTYLPLTTTNTASRGHKVRQRCHGFFPLKLQKTVTAFDRAGDPELTSMGVDSCLASPPDGNIAVGIASLKANQHILVGLGGLDCDSEAL
jgi:hypothetical protein